MAELSSKTYLDQVELKADPDTGNIRWVFRQDRTVITMDDILAPQFHRSAFDPTSPEASALLGEATASALAQLAPLNQQILDLQVELRKTEDDRDQIKATLDQVMKTVQP